VRQQVDQADARQGDQGLADRSVTDAEALGQLLRDEVGAGAEPPLEDVADQRLHDGLAALAVVALQRLGTAGGGHAITPARRGRVGRTMRRCRLAGGRLESIVPATGTAAREFYRIRAVVT